MLTVHCSVQGKFQYWMSHDVLHDSMWWNKSKEEMTPGQWDAAVSRIGHEWNKGTDTKSGKRRAHVAAPLVELVAVTDAAQTAIAAEPSEPSDLAVS